MGLTGHKVTNCEPDLVVPCLVGKEPEHVRNDHMSSVRMMFQPNWVAPTITQTRKLVQLMGASRNLRKHANLRGNAFFREKTPPQTT